MRQIANIISVCIYNGRNTHTHIDTQRKQSLETVCTERSIRLLLLACLPCKFAFRLGCVVLFGMCAFMRRHIKATKRWRTQTNAHSLTHAHAHSHTPLNRKEKQNVYNSCSFPSTTTNISLAFALALSAFQTKSNLHNF